MNIANKLTLLRVILVPFFAFFMLAGDIVPYSYLWAAVIFAVASITDTADGKIARKYNMVTNFGKFFRSACRQGACRYGADLLC